jgi:hypothetical protein
LKNSSPLRKKNTRRGSGLQAAHKGYEYQDSACAYFFAASLLEGFEQVVVDRKVVVGDRFDDLSVWQHGREIRRQFKSSEDVQRSFVLADLTTTRSDTRIDDLVRSYQRAGINAATEYRLCTTWLLPNDASLSTLLEPIKAEPSFHGHSTKMFRLQAEAIWPDGQGPLWSALLKATDLTREEFINFANRFVIELECPAASRSVFKPGPLENLLLDLLTQSIGIGRYPHQNRAAADVAAVLQRYASRSRSEGKTVRPTDVEHELQLNKNFGHVEQEFPLIASEAIRRSSLRNEIVSRLDARFLILEGPPGSGKSWELTGLTDDLSTAGYSVARHYCYLEPGDPEVQRRITTNVMYANLVFELVKANPKLEKLHRPAYSAGRNELESLLRKGTDLGIIDRVALIIDGVDHISRVFADAKGVARDEIDIIEELATLDLPSNVSVVIGSQPGDHLAPLRHHEEVIQMTPWRFDEIANMANRLHVPGELRRAGLSKSDVKEFLVELHERSEGNPLYATFLCRHILQRLVSGTTLDPIAGLRNAPLTGGDISVYYAHLLKSAEGSGATQPVAELLGLIDFGVTEDDLKEILPAFAHYVESAVSQLTPVLAPNRARRGIRIYHESFRRFIKDWISNRGGAISAVLAPVIAWLQQREFFKDGLAYRFLLPTLRQAGSHEELLALVRADFVSRSVEAGHPRAAVEQNLSLATHAAADCLSWNDLARCVELMKSCAVCFQDKLTDYDLYGRTFAAVNGADQLAERMLFDGRPAFGPQQGLIFCSLCDDAGVIAPWAQYLWHKGNDDDDAPAEDRDWVSNALVEFHGLIRLLGVDAVYDRIVSWLKRVARPNPDYFRGMMRRLVQFGGVELLQALLNINNLGPEIKGLIHAELAQSAAAAGRYAEAASHATEAVLNSSATSTGVECLLLGADRVAVAKRCPNLENFGVSEEKHYDPNATALRSWVDGVRIAAATKPSELVNLRMQVETDGWYTNWLRFVIDLSRAEEQSASDPSAAEAAILKAIAELASDTAPFKGEKRACDLYSERNIIQKTITRALRLVRTPASFEVALAHLAEISLRTTTYLQNSPGGPLIPEKFIEILMPFVSSSDFKKIALAEMTRQHKKVVSGGGELYDTLATADLLLARAYALAGNNQRAEQLWKSASVHLCAYGYRRELSILDLTESAPALGSWNVSAAMRLMADAQSLVNAVDAHTDGKETQYAPVYWAGSLSNIDPAGAAYVVGHSMIKYGGVIDWRCEDAFEEIVDELRERGAVSLVAFLEATVPTAGRGKMREKRIATVQRLIDADRELGLSLFRTLEAKLGNDADGAKSAAEEKPTSTSLKDRLFGRSYAPIFDAETTSLNLLATIRSRRHSEVGSDPTQDQFLNAFGYRLIEMTERGEEDEAVRLLTSLARETFFWESATLLADIANGLERHGKNNIAAVAYTLAYARSRGGGGYLYLGDENQLPWFLRACELSEPAALGTLAREITYLVNQQSYYLGITRHLVQALAARSETKQRAFDAWESAYGVLQHRLPSNETDHYVFEKYDPSIVSPWSVDESLLFLLLGRLVHPDFGRKTSALAGLLRTIEKTPEVVVRPLIEFLKRDIPTSAALLALQAVLVAECGPFHITTALEDELRAFYRCGLFGLRVMAENLLERAGLNAGPRPPAPRFSEKTVPIRKHHAILSLDWGNRTPNVEEWWPQFSTVLTSRFDDLWEHSKAMRDRSRTRYKAASSRAYDNLPLTRFLMWECEMFEMVFHEVLEGIDGELWRTGAWDPTIVPWLAQKILPRISFHAARSFSRVKRPNLPLPSESTEGVAPASPISSSNEFNGWYRCGYYERELVFRSMFHVDHKIIVMSAIHIGVASDEINTSLVPLAKGDVEVWMDGPTISNDLTIKPAFSGPLTGLDFVRDWLGQFPILMLQPDLQVRLGLVPAQSGPGGLRFVDEHGLDAIVFRQWEDRPVGENISEETPRLQGCELLVRPDIFKQLNNTHAQEPLTVVARLTSDGEDSIGEDRSDEDSDSKGQTMGENADPANESGQEDESCLNNPPRVTREDSRVIRT